jgi:hypothetical protein
MSDISPMPPSSPQFEIVKSQTAMIDIPVPRYMSVEHFCNTYHAFVSEIEIVGINGQPFVDLESTKAKLIILRAKFK